MLSPKGMYLVKAICGGRVTVTVNEQLAVWPAPEPVAVQLTAVVPTGKDDPDAGVQVVWIGAVPPVVVGAGHVTVAGWPWNDRAVCGAGQAIAS
jgi:hypothetical protein